MSTGLELGVSGQGFRANYALKPFDGAALLGAIESLITKDAGTPGVRCVDAEPGGRARCAVRS